MQRILMSALEAFASAVIFVPILFILNKLLFHNAKRTLFYCVFAFYLSALYAIVGLPTAYNFKFEFFLYLIPFVGMASDVTNSILNVILFIPLGLFLPVLWERFRKLKYTLAFGFCTTLIIELLQLFAHRKTDINDIITNVAGTIVGFLIAKIIIKKFPRLATSGKTCDLYIVSGISFAVMFLLQPLVASAIMIL